MTGRLGSQAPIETLAAVFAPVLPATRRSRTAEVRQRQRASTVYGRLRGRADPPGGVGARCIAAAHARGATEVTSIVRIA